MKVSGVVYDLPAPGRWPPPKISRTESGTLAKIKELHRPYQSWDAYLKAFVAVCAYDHTDWPCLTQRIIDGEE
jgi:hypothetical protein